MAASATTRIPITACTFPILFLTGMSGDAQTQTELTRSPMPLTADMVVDNAPTVGSGSHHASYTVKVARDTNGLLRYERDGTVVIDDPDAKTEIILYTARRQALRRTSVSFAPGIEFRLPILPDRSVSGESWGSNPKPVAIGDRTIEGQYAQGQRFSTVHNFSDGRLPMTVERDEWCSADNGQLVLVTVDNPRAGQSKISFTNLKMGEPPPSLFTLPDGYSTLDVGFDPAERDRIFDEAAAAAA